MIAIINGVRIGARSDERPGAMYRIVVINERDVRAVRLLADGECSIMVALLSSRHTLNAISIVCVGACPACGRCTVHTGVHR